MSDKNHEEEIAEIKDLVEDLAAGNRSVFKVPAKASRIMAREIIRLREKVDRLEDRLPSTCGQCDRQIEAEREVRIRSLEAPNPFCSKSCAADWMDEQSE